MTKSTSIIPVILSGGSGTRLWPLSRNTYPKQFLNLLEDGSLFQATLGRTADLTSEPPVVVTNDQHRFLVAEQIRQCGIDNPTIILEPAGRNTAPAIAVAALKIMQDNSPPPLMLVLPADHNINDTAAFMNAVETGSSAASQGKLVTFGIVPDRPETGYGYIRADQKSDSEAVPVNQFVEKPDQEKAKSYLASGDYYWNSGMFLFRADAYLDELGKHNPEMLAACEQAIKHSELDLDFFRLDKAAFESSPSDSIDYAVMEKTDKAWVVPLEAGWSDVGSWSSLASLNQQNHHDNITHGDTLIKDSKNCMVYSDHRLVTAVGVDDLVIVETSDAVLVTTKERAQDVKAIVDHLKEDTRTEAVEHRKIYRPWGHYDSIDAGERFQVKRIVVNPGSELSLQKHHHRAEHWIIVSGTAEVTRDEDVLMLTENQSTYIPLGSVHRLANRGKIPLELIEVQSGSYLGEDDIVRLSDNYGRSKPE